MILSMTGFGRASVHTDRKDFTIEIKSLNSKQLDLGIRMPASLRAQEVELRAILAPELQRGKVEVTATVENKSVAAPVELNINVLRDYRRQLTDMASELGLAEPQDWYSLLLRMPEAYISRSDDNDTEASADAEAVKEAALAALAELMAFRTREGHKLELFFREKIQNIRNLLLSVDPYEKERIEKVRQRLEEQLAKLASPEYDRDRLEQELIFYIEKLDVTEEKTRLAAHLEYFLATLDLPEPGQGKKLGFISQEMGREINTLGSKANHAELQRIVVKMKDELEQIKEQVLNVL